MADDSKNPSNEVPLAVRELELQLELAELKVAGTVCFAQAIYDMGGDFDRAQKKIGLAQQQANQLRQQLSELRRRESEA